MGTKEGFADSTGSVSDAAQDILKKLKEERDSWGLMLEYAEVMLPHQPDPTLLIDVQKLAATNDLAEILKMPPMRPVSVAARLDEMFRVYPVSPDSPSNMMKDYDEQHFGPQSILTHEQKAALAAFRSTAEQDGAITLVETLDFLAMQSRYSEGLLGEIPEEPAPALQKAAQYLLDKYDVEPTAERILFLGAQIEKGVKALDHELEQSAQPAPGNGFVLPFYEPKP